MRKTPARPIAGTMMQSEGGRYRYWVVRRWSVTEPIVMWTVLQPIRGGDVDNHTMKRIIGWSYRWGFGGVLITHLYPFCCKNWEELAAWRSEAVTTPGGYDWQEFERGAEEAARMARELRCKTRIAAWGKIDAQAHEDLDEWLAAFGSKPPSVCLGLTESGDPASPSARAANRVPENVELVKFIYPIPMARDVVA